MRIGLNATCLSVRSSGATQRFRGLYRQIFKRLRDTEFIVYEPCDCRIRDWFAKYDNVTFVATPLKSEQRVQKYFRGLPYWPIETKKMDFDLFESFNLPISGVKSRKNVLTIHDIRDLRFNRNPIQQSVYYAILSSSLKKANKIIAVSEVAREEMLEYFPDASISVVYNGVNVADFRDLSPEDILAVRRRLKLPDEYILAVGHFEARKNYLKLVDALSHMKRAGDGVNPVIVGNDSGQLGAVVARAALLGASDHLRVITGLPDSDVRAIYRSAKLLVFPSLYEGFGIPIIEAMASNIPWVLSDIPVFREITEEKGVYFNPHDSNAISATITSILSASSERDRLVEYGKKRVAEFTYEALARKLEQIYREVI
jgi:glycosyltransferase involved in cell wall biosynthesis